MAYVVPQMPLLVDLWHAFDDGTPNKAYASPDIAGIACNQSAGRREIMMSGTPSPVNYYALGVEFLMPKATDIRPSHNGVLADLIECPSGSKLFYRVQFVTQVARGFANEYRLVIASMRVNDTVFTDGTQAFPIPMP